MGGGGQRGTSLCPNQSVATDFGTQSHAIKDESDIISKGWFVWGALSSGSIN